MRLRVILATFGCFAILLGALLAPYCSALSIAETRRTYNAYPTGSWGLGVVVPQSAEFENGSHLSWNTTKNVTVSVRLPDIRYTDNTIYAILSVMAKDESVLQIAAGIYPNQNNWFAYAFIIRDVRAYPQSYTWVLNSSRPEMNAGAQITLSIYLFSDRWSYAIEDINTHERITGEYSSSVTPSMRNGDQEVFALESYSSSRNVFERMGNLSLSSILVDGQRVIKDWYYYGDWDGVHNPLFVIGGLSPPSFISVAKVDNTIEWSFTEWKGTEQPNPYNPFAMTMTLIVIAVVIVITIAAVVFEVKSTRAEHKKPKR